MSEATYMVVFRGQLVDGAELEQVKERLQDLCKLTGDKVEQLFSLPAVVMKKNLSHELAHSFMRQLERIGVITEVKAMAEATLIQVAEQDPGAAAPADAPPGAAHDTLSGASAGTNALQVEFHGKGGEYFKIWIVNILLTIATLGIYSAWAKVRNHRYFYSNTQIGNASFEYTANPKAILKGRVVAVICLIAFNYMANFMPEFSLALGLILLVAVPWLINRSMAFRNRNTVYRNVRFGFDGDYLGALKAFILWPIAGVLTLGLLIPMALYKQQLYLVGNARYGTSPFTPGFTGRDVYGIAGRALLMMLLAVALVGLGTQLGPFAILTVLAAMVFYLLTFAYFTANMTNLVYNGSTLQGQHFESTLEMGDLAMIYFSNYLIVTFSLGLATPWAKVRLAKYHAENLVVVVAGTLDSFIAAEEQNVSALGEEIGEAFDLEVGL